MEIAEKPNYRFVGTMTEMEKSSQRWVGETGYITKPMLVEYIGDLTRPNLLHSRPCSNGYCDAQNADEAGADDDNIRTEEFSRD